MAEKCLSCSGCFRKALLSTRSKSTAQASILRNVEGLHNASVASPLLPRAVAHCHQPAALLVRQRGEVFLSSTTLTRQPSSCPRLSQLPVIGISRSRNVNLPEAIRSSTKSNLVGLFNAHYENRSHPKAAVGYML